MKRLILNIAILVLMSFSATTVTAQSIPLGERLPRFKHAKWLNGSQPEKCDFTYVEFIHSASAPCRNSAERIHKIVSGMESVAFMLISHQSATEIDEWVTRLINTRSGVIVDDKHIRTALGINYAPFAVIFDHKRRALWFGNPQLLNEDKIKQLTSK